MNQIHIAENASERVREAQALARTNRAAALTALNDLFRARTTPSMPLHGRYSGELVLLDIAPGLTPLAAAITTVWMPWKGKTFDSSKSTGDNIFHKSSYLPARILWPLYRGYMDDGADTYRAFAFRTYVAPGRDDPDRQVLKIDYDIPANPMFSIRRVLDELVQIGDRFYLGKAHLKWWWGRWQLVAYFSLSEKP